MPGLLMRNAFGDPKLQEIVLQQANASTQVCLPPDTRAEVLGPHSKKQFLPLTFRLLELQNSADSKGDYVNFCYLSLL
jgi:hypothetical protein